MPTKIKSDEREVRYIIFADKKYLLAEDVSMWIEDMKTKIKGLEEQLADSEQRLAEILHGESM